MSKNYYEILGVSQNASLEEIKKKYKELVRKYHPDICKDEDATERASEINVAYDILSNEVKRKQYDESLKNNTTYEDIVEEQEEPFNYDEEIKNYTEREKEFAKRIALEKIIKEELNKLFEILDARIEVIKSSITVDNIIEDYYFEQVDKWWQIADNYLNNLDNLIIEAETNNLNHLIGDINTTINTLNNEMQGMPLTILDAENYITSRENKNRVINQITEDIKYINSLLNTNTNFYDQIISGFIDEANYDRYRETKIYEIENALKKVDSMKKLAELYGLTDEMQFFSNLEEYTKSLKRRKKKIPKDYQTAKKKAEHYIFYKERETLADEIKNIVSELRKMKTKMYSGVGNIVTLREMRDITARYKIAKSKLSTLERKQERYNIEEDYSNSFYYDSATLETAYDETAELRTKHIEEFFKTYSDSTKRKDIKGLLLHDNVGLTGLCVLNGAAATLSIMTKNYLSPAIPLTVALTGFNAYNLKQKYAIYKHNYKKGTMIINSNQDTKEEYKEYCLKNNIKRKTP